MTPESSPLASVTVDMDGLDCYTAIHGLPLPTGQYDPVFTIALRRFLDLFQEFNIKATFFCIGKDLHNPAHADLFRSAVERGHELANHSYSHLYNLRAHPIDLIRSEIIRAAELIEAISGLPPVGFRTPGYNISPDISRTLKQLGYLYDSSLFPCPPYFLAKGAVMSLMRLKRQPSRSQMNLPLTLSSPTSLFLADPHAPWRRVSPLHHPDAGIWEVPMCVLPGIRFPIIGTSLHLLGEAGISAIFPLLSLAYPRLLQLEFHGIDLLDASDPGIPHQLFTLQHDLPIPLERKHRTYRSLFSRAASQYTFMTLADAVRRLS